VRCASDGFEETPCLDIHHWDFDSDFLLNLFTAAEDTGSACTVVEEIGDLDGEAAAFVA
jgi:hypothetical protein